MMYGEAVVYLNRTLAEQARFVRKQITQLPSKMRFVAAQFNALLDDELWLRSARHANAMAARLHEAVADAPGSSSTDHRPSTACSRRCRPTPSSRSAPGARSTTGTRRPTRSAG